MTNETLSGYRPSNRTGTAPLGELAFVAGGTYWFVDDIDYHGTPIAYGSPDSAVRILPHMGKFVISDTGRFLKWPPRRGASKGRNRYFPTAIAAAEYAMLGGSK